MSKKIIGITVGTRLPKPNFNQTDPTKGDYIKNKPDFDGLQNEVSIIHNLVGDTSVSEQITMATSDLSTKTELEQAIFEKADTVRNAEGTTITLNDSAKTPIQGLNLYGKTTQNGTPTPDAPVPMVSASDGGDIRTLILPAVKSLKDDTLCGIPVTSGGNYTDETGQQWVCDEVDFGRGVYVQRVKSKNVAGSSFVTAESNGYPVGDSLMYYTLLNDNRAGTRDVLCSKLPYNAGVLRKNTNGCYCNGFRVYCRIQGVSDLAEFQNLIDGASFEYILATPIETALSAEELAAYAEKYGGTGTVYGRTSQNGTPTPEAPVELVSHADVCQSVLASTPNGLPGIPVTTGGNYTDETGQQWVCDEVDFGRGVYVQRIFRTIFKSAVGWSIAGASNGSKRFYTNQFMGVIKNTKDDATKGCGLCSHFINVTPADTWYEVTGISINSKGRLDIYYSGIEQTTAALEEYFVSNPVAFMAELATPIETPLSAEELTAYAALHTNYPNTTILNDGGAGMEVRYCTPLTSVPMVHGEADSGKILAIDEHGCVAKIEMDDFGSGSIDVDFDISNDAEANLINADTLGGASASEYVKQEGIKDSLSIDLDEIVNGTAQPTNADMLGNVPAEKVFSDLDGKLSMELIWENASPTSEFVEQELSIPALADYTKVYIEFRSSSGYLERNGVVAPFESGFSTSFSYNSNIRVLTRNGTTVTVGNVQADNRYCVPEKIYGIKGVSA